MMQHSDNPNLEPRTSNLEPGSNPAPRILNYVAIIIKHRRLIAGITLAATILSVIVVLLRPSIYTAKAMILPVEDDKGGIGAMMAQLGGLAGIAGAGLGGPTKTDLYLTMLKSEAVKDPIIDRFKLMEIYKDKYRMDAYRALDKNAVFVAGKKDGIITIMVDDKDPKRAAEMANSYVEELGKLAIRLNVTGAGQNRTFLEERLSTAKADLARAEENLKAFQAKNKAVQVTAQAEATIKGVAEMRAQLAAQEVQLATYRRQFTESSQEVKNMATSIRNVREQLAKLEGGGGNGAIPSVGSVPSIGQEYVRLMREFKIQESLVELLTKQNEMAKLLEAKDISPFQVILKAKVPEKKSKPARSKIVTLTLIFSLLVSSCMAIVLENVSNLPESEKARWRSLIRRE